LQRMFLAEIARLLKPEGKVFLGIENRFGLQYLLGHKDHSGLSFTSLAPRPVADWMVARSAGSGQKRPRKREFFHREQTRYRTYTYSLWGYRRLLNQAGLDQFRPYWAWQSYSYPRMSGSMDASSLRFVAENLSSSFRRPWQRLALRLLSFVPRRVSSSLIRLFAPYFLIIAGPGGEDGTLQQRVLAADPAAQSFVRLSLSPSPGLDTTYLLLDGRANVSRLVRVGEPGHSPTGRGTFEVVEEQGGVGRPIRLYDRGEVILAARWLAEFQSGSKKGRWSERQLADEMRALTEAALSLPGFDDLRLRLKDFESRYLNALSSRGLSMVSEQGDFTPLNVLITPQGELTPAHWDFSRARGVPYMDVGGFYHSLFHRTAGAMEAGKYLPGDAPVDWFAEGLAGRVRIPIALTSPYYLLRVIRRAREDRGADAIAVGAFTELGSQLRAALDHSLSAESLDS
ncbi:MAG TPA: hypothetical protein VIU39_15745, partial [Anaerolineales bacterium]